MIAAYAVQDGRTVKTDFIDGSGAYFWIDLLKPTDQEKRQVELYLNLPLERMNDNAISNRFFRTKNANYMSLLMQKDGNIFLIATEKVLVTLHDTALTTVCILPDIITTSEDVLLFFINTFVQEISEAIEVDEQKLLALSSVVNTYAKNEAEKNTEQTLAQKRTVVVLNDLHTSMMNHRRRLINIRLLVDFSNQSGLKILEKEEQRIDVLIEHTKFLNDQLNFLQSSVFDCIGIVQYNLQSRFNTFAAVFFLPALIMSFFSMNFSDIPFLQVKNSILFFSFIAVLGTYLIYRNLGQLQFA
jgi:magnesium transporter